MVSGRSRGAVQPFRFGHLHDTGARAAAWDFVHELGHLHDTRARPTSTAWGWINEGWG